MTSFATLDKRFEEALSRVDFQRIRKAMIALDWKWGNEKVPTVKELRESVVHLWKSLKNTWQKEGEVHSIGSGGFVVERGYHEVSIRFEVTHQEFPL